MNCQYCHIALDPDRNELYGGFCSAVHRDLHAEVLRRRELLSLETARSNGRETGRLEDGSDGCPFCGNTIPLLAKLRGERFCSAEHEEQFQRRGEAQIMDRLNWHAQGGAGSGAMISGRKPKLKRSSQAAPPEDSGLCIPLADRPADWAAPDMPEPDPRPSRNQRPNSGIGFARASASAVISSEAQQLAALPVPSARRQSDWAEQPELRFAKLQATLSGLGPVFAIQPASWFGELPDNQPIGSARAHEQHVHSLHWSEASDVQTALALGSLAAACLSQYQRPTRRSKERFPFWFVETPLFGSQPHSWRGAHFDIQHDADVITGSALTQAGRLRHYQAHLTRSHTSGHTEARPVPDWRPNFAMATVASSKMNLAVAALVDRRPSRRYVVWTTGSAGAAASTLGVEHRAVEWSAETDAPLTTCGVSPRLAEAFVGARLKSHAVARLGIQVAPSRTSTGSDEIAATLTALSIGYWAVPSPYSAPSSWPALIPDASGPTQIRLVSQPSRNAGLATPVWSGVPEHGEVDPMQRIRVVPGSMVGPKRRPSSWFLPVAATLTRPVRPQSDYLALEMQFGTLRGAGPACLLAGAALPPLAGIQNTAKPGLQLRGTANLHLTVGHTTRPIKPGYPIRFRTPSVRVLPGIGAITRLG